MVRDLSKGLKIAYEDALVSHLHVIQIVPSFGILKISWLKIAMSKSCIFGFTDSLIGLHIFFVAFCPITFGNLRYHIRLGLSFGQHFSQ